MVERCWPGSPRKAASQSPLRILVLLPGIFMVALTSGCADVKPWERGTLAKPHMAIQPFPVSAALREHIYGSRESASGGSASAGGGGCGCY